MKQKQYIFILISLVLIFIIVTIILLAISGFFISYNSQLFNNIVTPLATICSSLIFFFSLILIFHQNHITNSGLVLNTYLDKIAKLKEKGLAWDFHFHYPKEMKRLNVQWKPNLINSAQLIDKLCAEIGCSREYNNFLSLLNRDNPVTFIEFQKEAQMGKIFTAIDYNSGVIFNDIKTFHQKVYNLVSEIKFSRELTDFHKNMLVNAIMDEILDEYISYCDVVVNGNRHILINIKIPDYQKSEKSGKLETIGILEEFWYVDLYSHLKQNCIIPRDRKSGLIEQHSD